MYDYAALDRSRQRINKLIVFLDLIQAIISPIVLKVLVNLPVQGIRQGFIFPEPGQEGHPIVQLKCFLFDPQVPIECRNDLDEARHHKREKRHTSQHNHYA
jgi:hypothetical protein